MAKRLYRNTDNKMIGGVCSGIAEYFDLHLFASDGSLPSSAQAPGFLPTSSQWPSCRPRHISAINYYRLEDRL